MADAVRQNAPLPRPLIWVLVASFVARVFFAAVMPLGTDETYALAVGRSFSISFFDHPPLGFWAPAVMERIWPLSAPIWFRVPELVFGTVALWAIYLCGAALGGPRAGIWAAVIAAISPTMFFAGVIILPDGLLNPALFFTLYALIRLAQGDTAGLKYWAIGGASLAIALASKYQAGLIPISLLVWMFATPEGRRWFAMPGFYLALAISCVGLMPVLWWNIGNGWASFAFHEGRAGGGLSISNFAKMAVGQIVYLLPVVVVWCVSTFRDRSNWVAPDRRLILLVALGPILMFNAIYLFSTATFPHWTMPGWIVLLPLIGATIAAAPQSGQTRARRWLIGIAAPVYLILAVATVHLSTGVLTRFSDTPPAWDRTAPMIPLAETHARLIEAGIWDATSPIATRNWIEAGHIAAAIGPAARIKVLSDTPHHFAFMPGQDAQGPITLISIGSIQTDAADTDRLLQFARAIDPDATALPSVAVPRGAQDYFRIHAVKMTVPAN